MAGSKATGRLVCMGCFADSGSMKGRLQDKIENRDDGRSHRGSGRKWAKD